MMSPEEIAASMDRGTAMARDYIRDGFVKVTLPAADPNDHSEDGLEHFDTTPHDADGVVIEPSEPAPTVSIIWPTEPNTTTAAPSQGSTGGRPGEPSPDEVLAAAVAKGHTIASQSERSTTPSRELGVTEDVPAFLRRTARPAEAAAE